MGFGWSDVAGIAAGSLGGVADLIGFGVSNRQSKIQRSWLERMSSTAHQREVKDLKAAGLNPILSATGGYGASTPTSSVVADFDGSGMVDTANKLSPLYRAQVDTQKALTRKEDALTIQANAQTDLARADALLKESQNALNVAKMTDIYSDVRRKEIENRFSEIGSKYDYSYDGKSLSDVGYRRYFKDARFGNWASELLNAGASFDDTASRNTSFIFDKIKQGSEVLFHRIKESSDRIKASHRKNAKDSPSRDKDKGTLIPLSDLFRGLEYGHPSSSGGLYK